jgi:hypothetical protein
MQRHVQSDVVPNLRTIRDLRIEAEGLEAEFGPNPYSKYLRENGRRPDPATAATMGRWMGGRVTASDGTMQPVAKRDRV